MASKLTVTDILAKIAWGIDWVTKELSKLRLETARKMADAISDPKTGVIALIGIIAGSVLLSMAIEWISQLAVVKTVTAFLKNIGNVIARVAEMMHLDLLITLILIGKTFNKDWNKALAGIYTALSNVSKELALDFSFINVFAEVNRSILYTSYQFTKHSWAKSQADFALGITDYLGGIEDRLDDYIDNPDLIFIDIQKSISNARTDKVDTGLGTILAGIDYAAEWIKEKGDILIDGFNDLYSQFQKFPEDVRIAIDTLVDPLKKKLDDFVSDVWTPFWDKYQVEKGYVMNYLNAHDIDIEGIKDRIDDPVDWIKTILGMDMDSQDTFIDAIYDFIMTRKREALEKAIDPSGDTFQGIAESIKSITELAHKIDEYSDPIIEGLQLTETPSLKMATWFVGESDGNDFAANNQSKGINSWYQGG